MTFFDIALIRIWDLPSWTGLVLQDQVQVLVLRASSILDTLYQGKKHRVWESGYSRASQREFLEVAASFTSDGWRPLENDLFSPVGILVKGTEVSSSQTVSINDRLKYLDGLFRTKKIDGDVAQLFQSALMKLELLETSNNPTGVQLVELLERLTESHRNGYLSDQQFEAAKNKALGL